MYEAAERSEQRLGLPVNPVLCSRERWLAKADPLIQQVRTAPVVWVVGEEPRQEGGDWCAGVPEQPPWSACSPQGTLSGYKAPRRTAHPGSTPRDADFRRLV